MRRQISLGLVEFRDDHTEPPFRKAHLTIVPEEYVDESDGIDSTNEVDDSESQPEDDAVGLQVMPSVIYKQSQVAVKYLRKLMGAKVFNNPKDHEVLARLFHYCTGSAEDAIFLDSFAGSGSSAHAVLALNAEDGGKRKFVLVQQPYDTKKDEKAGRNIAKTITAERVRRVIGGKKSPAIAESFNYVRVGPALFSEYRELGKKLPSYAELAKYIFYTETSHDFDKKALNPKTGKIGEYRKTSYYLLYTPNNKEDQALDLKWLKSIEKSEKNRNLVVYCEKIWIHRDDLAKYQKETGRKVRPMLVPFNLK
jgi:adenine-specific DNA-methyltransferase